MTCRLCFSQTTIASHLTEPAQKGKIFVIDVSQKGGLQP